KQRKKNPSIMLGVVLLLLISGPLGVSWKVLALSPTLQIQIAPQPPFFSPHSISTVSGTMVQWENRTREPHTILSDDCFRGSRCSFESRIIEPGGTFAVPNLPPGEYAYHCGIHPFMRGILTVRGKSSRVQSADI
ncbi:MAG: cupredoxin domain-containing protein, partial [Nitrospirales bacterium]